MKKMKLLVKTNTQKYPIIIGSKLTTQISKIFKENSINFKKCFLFIDKNVPRKFISNIKKSLRDKNIYFHFFDASEKNKNFNNINKILEILLRKKLFKTRLLDFNRWRYYRRCWRVCCKFV